MSRDADLDLEDQDVAVVRHELHRVMRRNICSCGWSGASMADAAHHLAQHNPRSARWQVSG